MKPRFIRLNEGVWRWAPLGADYEVYVGGGDCHPSSDHVRLALEIVSNLESVMQEVFDYLDQESGEMPQAEGASWYLEAVECGPYSDDDPPRIFLKLIHSSNDYILWTVTIVKSDNVYKPESLQSRAW